MKQIEINRLYEKMVKNADNDIFKVTYIIHWMSWATTSHSKK